MELSEKQQEQVLKMFGEFREQLGSLDNDLKRMEEESKRELEELEAKEIEGMSREEQRKKEVEIKEYVEAKRPFMDLRNKSVGGNLWLMFDYKGEHYEFELREGDELELIVKGETIRFPMSLAVVGGIKMFDAFWDAILPLL